MVVITSFVASASHSASCRLTVSRALAAARPIASALTLRHVALEQAALGDRHVPRRMITLRDIFAPRRLEQDEFNGNGVVTGGGEKLSSFGDEKRAQLHRLDRLQEVANLALEDRAGKGEAWGCADIGTDHGLLAICLHANGANVVAGDRAVSPLDVARQNVRLFVSRAGLLPGTCIPPERATGGMMEHDAYHHNVPQQEGRSEACRRVPRLELRLGEGLSVLEEGEVDTVCIAGVGVRTMVKILADSDGGRRSGRSSSFGGPEARGSWRSRASPNLPALGVRRLVLQPMDSRLDYMRCLRVWLSENDWQITQETIVLTPGKGGIRAFITLRAESASGAHTDERGKTPAAMASSDLMGGLQNQSDWLGDFLPARATDPRQLRDSGRAGVRREAVNFLAYLRHQRDWLRAIEQARSQNSGETNEVSSTPTSVGVEGVLVAVEEAIRVAGGPPRDLGADVKESLATARRWRKKKRGWNGTT